MICETYFTFQKQFDATIILSFDNLAAIFGYISKNWAIFQISGHSDPIQS
jgi:hypothetical protein